LGQSAPTLQALVQYSAPRQPKLHVAAAVQARPVSSAAQYPAVRLQRRPAVVHPEASVHGCVHRCAPPGTRGRHSNGEAQSPSEVQRSSSCSLIVPPLVLLVDEEVLEVVVVVLDEVDEVLDALVDDAVDVAAPAPELLLGPTAPVPVVEDVVPAPPVLVVVAELAELEDDAPPVPVGGTHSAFWSQMKPLGQSREASTQFFWQEPLWQ
jgi:hypothetical protein